MMFVKIFMNSKGRKCAAVIAGLPDREVYVSFDTCLICELLDVKPSDLKAMDVGKYKI